MTYLAGVGSSKFAPQVTCEILQSTLFVREELWV